VSSKREVIGNVQAWYSEEGWGVLVSPEVEGTVFAHFSALDVSGYRDLGRTRGVPICDARPGWLRVSSDPREAAGIIMS
jgi:cold shock CspA family protein